VLLLTTDPGLTDPPFGAFANPASPAKEATDSLRPTALPGVLIS